jgi:hypothetical protein
MGPAAVPLGRQRIQLVDENNGRLPRGNIGLGAVEGLAQVAL